MAAGGINRPDVKHGFALTRQSVLKLNQLVVSALIEGKGITWWHRSGLFVKPGPLMLPLLLQRAWQPVLCPHVYPGSPAIAMLQSTAAGQCTCYLGQASCLSCTETVCWMIHLAASSSGEAPQATYREQLSPSAAQ